MGVLGIPGAVGGAILDPIAAKIRNPFSRSVENNSRPPDFPEGFQFVEIVDGREQTKEKVVLLGNMLPQIPFQFGGTQRVVKDYYPGNSEPTVQVLGSKESDLTIRGKLKDKRYRDTDLYGVSTEIQKLIDAIRIRGNLLRINLGEWQRYGFLEETIFKMNKLSEIEYELKFSIVGFNVPRNNKFVDESKAVPFSINKELIQEALEFQEEYSSVPESMPASIADLLNDAISDVATAVNVVTNFVETVVSVSEDIVASGNRAIGLIKNARANISRYKRRVGSIKLNVDSFSTKYSKAKQFSSLYTNQAHIARSMTALSILSALLARLQKQFEAIAKTTPRARHRVRQADTLQNISIKYYNTAEHWKKIYDHNKLTSTQLNIGSVLEIPRL